MVKVANVFIYGLAVVGAHCVRLLCNEVAQAYEMQKLHLMKA